jgi:hypothetical protein
MRPGLDNDDIYVMVEDEFLSTAHLYTSHLHKAEYLRLKKLARAQNASTIHNIARPVDDRTNQSMESRKKMEGQSQRVVQQAAMRNLQGDRQIVGRGEDEDEEEDPWMRDPRLKGLMTQRETSTHLSKITGIKSKTRASAGYAQLGQTQPGRREVEYEDENEVSARRAPVKQLPRPPARPEESEDSDSDDLGGPSISYSKPMAKSKPRDESIYRPTSRTTYTSTTARTTTEKRIDSFHSSKSNKSPTAEVPRNSSYPSTTNLKPTSSDISIDFDDFDGFPRRQALPNRIAGRLGRQRDDQNDEAKKKRSLKAEEVPTFLF